MRMDDAVSIGRHAVAVKSHGDIDAATRILCHLTSEGSNHDDPRLSDDSNDGCVEVDMWF